MARDNHYTNQQRYELRLEQAKPILDELKSWLEKSLKTAASKSKLGDALTYQCNPHFAECLPQVNNSTRISPTAYLKTC